MTDGTAAPVAGPGWAQVTAWCTAHGLGPIVGADALDGGAISTSRRLRTASGSSLVLKQAGLDKAGDAPADLYLREAEGLAALADAGFLATPAVHLSGGGFLLLEDLGSAPVTDAAWVALGRQLARQHRDVTAPEFGWATDNYLGRLPQHNPWTVDGHAFFAEHRILRWLDTAGCDRALSATDRAAVERLAARLPELIPTQPASLLHGDLWRANVLGQARIGQAGGAAVIDPAVHYGWAEAELSMVRGCGGVPGAFFDAYREINPLGPGWEGRLDLLHIREVLSMVAHFGDSRGSLLPLRAILTRFA